ncbi:OprO/OprP family phosphate-selective porin [Olivibacter sp. SA151]|uniref:porin n=1 Tax=Olivibacter jilunii TaxID=985016 RepID=UPI003F151753
MRFRSLRTSILFLFFSIFFTIASATDTLPKADSISLQDQSNKNVRRSLLRPKPDSSRNESLRINILLRSALHGDGLFNENGQNKLSLDDARIDIGGNYNDKLSYRLRYRLNKPFETTLQDNASRALDWAYIQYKFGAQNSWSITAGKQSALVGSYEFQNTPIYELKFSDYVDKILNLFVVGATLSKQITKNHSFNIQIYNTTNDGFDKLFQVNNLQKDGLQPATTPLGSYFTWIGAFHNQKIHTKWSYNMAQFAKGLTNHSISLANKYTNNKTSVYLDLQYSYLPVDHVMIATPIWNAIYNRSDGDATLARDIEYKSAIIRLDQFLTKKWEISLKGAYETTSSRRDQLLSNNFRKNYTYTAAIQHKPFESQDLRFYLAYIGNTVSHQKSFQMPTTHFDRLSLGFFYTIPAF